MLENSKKEYRKNYYQKNKERENKLSKEYHKQYYKNNKQYLYEYFKQGKLNNLEHCKQYSKEYFIKYRSSKKYKNYQKQYHKIYYSTKLKNNIKYRLDSNMRNILWYCLKGKKAGIHGENLVGYTIKDLMKHLEKQFNNKMNGNNGGVYGEIDHIIPKSLFNYSSYEDNNFKKCWSLSNLQPLEKSLNRKKYNKLLNK